MNDEIKEILDDLLFTTTLPNVSIKLNKEKLNQLLDYITNLQQDRIEYSNELEDYKSRCEKAVEYIKNCPEYLWENVNTKELLNILNNGGDDNE